MIITYNKKKYPEMTTNQLMAWGGFIPLWVMEWNLRKAMGVEVSLFDHLDTQYEARAGLGIKGRDMNGVIDKEGIYRYPNDPPMPPFMTWETEAGTVYFYPYSVMGIPKDDSYTVVRMD
jgi:hypothetical protein